MEAPHQLGTGRGIRPSQISVICGMDHEFSEHNNIIKLYSQSQQNFARLWWCLAGPHLQRHTRLGTFPLLQTSPLHLWIWCWRRRWLLTITSREMALPRCLARQKRPCPLHFLGITMVPAGQKDSNHPMRILSCIPTEPLHLPGLHFSSYQAGRWESLQL